MFQTSRIVRAVLVFTFLAIPAFAGKPSGASSEVPVLSALAVGPRLSGDLVDSNSPPAPIPYQHNVDGVRSVFLDSHHLLALNAYASVTRRRAQIDLTSPAEAGLSSRGISLNSSLSLNVRGQIATMTVGEVRAVDALFTFDHDTDGRKYRVNFSGTNGTDLVRVERISDSQWVATAGNGSRARLWDVTRGKAVLVGLYYMDFHLTITRP